MSWLLAIAGMCVAFFLGAKYGKMKEQRDADEAIRKLIDHAQTMRKSIDDMSRDALINRVRGARRSNGSV